jgi:hypothetical protein
MASIWPDLIRWFRFDDGTGTSAVDSTGTANGSLVNTPTWLTPGNAVVQGGLQFAAASSQRVDVSSSITLSQATIAGWFKQTSAAVSGLFCADNFSATPRNALLISNGNSTTQYQFAAHVNGTGGAVNVDVTTTEWHHLALAWNGAGTATAYVDGVAADEIAVGSASPAFLNWRIGCHFFSGSNQRHWSGSADDVRIYSRALSADDMLTLAAWRGRDTRPRLVA